MSTTNVDITALLASQAEAFVVAGVAFVAGEMADLNNAGGGGAPPAPKDTGNLRGSFRVSVGSPTSEPGVARPKRGVGYPLTTPRDVRRAIQLGGFGGFKAGDTVWLRWLAPYANIINLGRTTDKNGRPIGSEKAPDGWVFPDLNVALARLANWKWADEA